jgi:hypothetical protein
MVAFLALPLLELVFLERSFDAFLGRSLAAAFGEESLVGEILAAVFFAMASFAVMSVVEKIQRADERGAWSSRTENKIFGVRGNFCSAPVALERTPSQFQDTSGLLGFRRVPRLGAPRRIEDVQCLDQLGVSLYALGASGAELVEGTHEQRVPGRRAGAQAGQLGVSQVTRALVGSVLGDLGDGGLRSWLTIILAAAMAAVPVLPSTREPRGRGMGAGAPAPGGHRSSS